MIEYSNGNFVIHIHGKDDITINQNENTIRIKPTPKEEEKTKVLEAKIVLLGNINVGKTSIASRYCKNSFNEHHINTIGGAYQQQKVVLSNGSMVKLHIWDTSGQERFRAMTNLYYRDAQVAILTYDITSESSFQGIEFWIEELKYKVENENMLLYLVGNKSDVSNEERKISKEKGKKFAEDNNMIFFETSAKTGEGVKELFVNVASQVYEQLKK